MTKPEAEPFRSPERLSEVQTLDHRVSRLAGTEGFEVRDLLRVPEIALLLSPVDKTDPPPGSVYDTARTSQLARAGDYEGLLNFFQEANLELRRLRQDLKRRADAEGVNEAKKDVAALILTVVTFTRNVGAIQRLEDQTIASVVSQAIVGRSVEDIPREGDDPVILLLSKIAPFDPLTAIVGFNWRIRDLAKKESARIFSVNERFPNFSRQLARFMRLTGSNWTEKLSLRIERTLWIDATLKDSEARAEAFFRQASDAFGLSLEAILREYEQKKI